MTKLNRIGLDSEASGQLAESLNKLLADYQIFYQNTRGFHWNIKGEKFFELHLKFEELYTDLQVKIDEIAERILTLGHTPIHTFTEYLEASSIAEAGRIADGKQAVGLVLDAFRDIIVLQRDLLDLSGQAGDEGTNALMSDYIREQEKLVWMYSAFLG